MDHSDLHNEPLRDRRENAHKYLTEATFWANLRIAYAHVDADHVRLDLAKSYVEFSEHDFFRTLAIGPEDQLMRRASVLSPDWLKHAGHIDQMALEEADEKYGCVPTQLTEALLNNRRPIKRLPNNAEVSLDSVKTMLDLIKDDNPFADPGYSTRHVAEFIMHIGLTYYAYNANNKCFKHEVGHLAQHCHHSPLAWYATQGHMYLLTKEANRSVSAEQKEGGRGRPTKATAQCEKEERPVKFVTAEEARAAFELVDTPTIYVVDVDDLDELFLEYVDVTRVLPKVKLVTSRKMEFSVMVRDKTKSELKIDLQAAKQADPHGYMQTFGDCKAATLSKTKMGDRLTASGVSTEEIARNGTVDYTHSPAHLSRPPHRPPHVPHRSTTARLCSLPPPAPPTCSPALNPVLACPQAISPKPLGPSRISFLGDQCVLVHANRARSVRLCQWSLGRL